MRSKMKKYFIILFLFFVGCNTRVSKEELAPWEEVCKPHGGLQYVLWPVAYKVPDMGVCNDGTRITELPTKKKE